MPTYSYRCKDCDNVFNSTASISDRNNPVACNACGGEAPRNWSGPGVIPLAMQAGMADGHIPAGRKAEFANEKEAARLEAESYNMPPEKRGEIKKEIKKLRKSDS